MSSPGPDSRTGPRGRSGPRLAFGPFELDPAAGILRAGDLPIALDAKPFELLLHLARHAGQILSRRDLLDALWPEGTANEDAVVQCVVEVRRALGDATRNSRYLRTVPRRGYLLAVEVTALDVDEGEAEPLRPQLVLAFPAPAAAAVVARKLGAERIITGSFVRVEDRFVINAQLVDAASGRTEANASVRGQHPAQLLEAVDELTLRLLHHLEPPEAAGSPWRPSRLTTASVQAERFYLEALDEFARGGRQGAEQAESRLGQALKLDPAFAQEYV